MSGLKRNLAYLATAAVLASGGAIAAVELTGEDVTLSAAELASVQTACATATTPDHVIGVDGTGVHTIPGESSTECATVTAETVTEPGPTTTVTATVTTPAASERLSGSFQSGRAVAGQDAFGTWRNKPVAFAVDYMGGGTTTWSHWTNPPDRVDSFAGKYRLHLSPGLWPKGTSEATTTFSLAAGARGDYDSHWVDLATALIAQGQGDSIIRPGHEITGNWYSYTVCTAYKGTTWSATKAADFAKYFRRIVDAMRSVPGGSFTFEFNTSNGLSCAPPAGTDALAALYPGDSWTDYVGRDFYDRCFSPTPGVCADPVQRWGTVINGRGKLNDVAAFAALHAKPLFFSEYGINDVASDGFGDNPYFIQKAWEFFEAHDTAGESYFNVNSSDGFKHELWPSTQYPNAAARYRSLFGG